jgi:peptidoglycan/LPS O-acetylase OafA/YrhL
MATTFKTFPASEQLSAQLNVPMTAGSSVVSLNVGSRVPALDGVRGLAVLAVMLLHCGNSFTHSTLTEHAIKKLLSGLWPGVNVFFVLSAFLITGILLNTRQSPNYFRAFYARRVLRIFPLYFVALAILLVILPGLNLIPKTSRSEQLWLWLYLYNWHVTFQSSPSTFLIHFWSLAIEEQFYLIWPALVYLLGPRISRVCLFGIAVSFTYRLVMCRLHVPTAYVYFPTSARLEDLCIGALAACVVCNSGWLACFRANVKITMLIAAAALLSAALAARGFEAIKWPPLLWGTTAVCTLTAAALIMTHSGSDCRLSKWLSFGLLRWFGKYSYGLYVIHLPVYAAIAHYFVPAGSAIVRLLCGAGVTASVIMVSSGAAYLSYTHLEAPFLRLKKRFSYSWPQYS